MSAGVKVVVLTESEIRGGLARLEAEYPWLASVDRDECCTGCVEMGVFYAYGSEGANAFVEYDELLHLLGEK